MKKVFVIIYITFFMLMLFLPLIFKISGIIESKESSENRKLAEFPRFDTSKLDLYPIHLENYFNDHFTFRNTILSYLSFFQSRYLLKSPHPEKVVLGNQDWMFAVNSDLNYVIGRECFSNQQIDSIIFELKRRLDTCKKMGIDYRIVIVPSKARLYSEYLPYYYSISTRNPVTDIIKEIEKKTTIPILYLLDDLNDKKRLARLYLKHDTHWNDAGTYYGYLGIINWLKKDYPNLKEYPLNIFRIKDTLIMRGNLVEQLGLEDFYFEEKTIYTEKIKLPFLIRKKENYPVWSWFGYPWEYERAYQNIDSTLPGLMIIRDSYTNDLLQKLMACHFGRTTVIWDYWQHKLNYNLIKAEKPHLVIDIINELFLKNYALYPEKYSAKIDTSGL